jgi:hypothetical protein
LSPRWPDQPEPATFDPSSTARPRTVSGFYGLAYDLRHGRMGQLTTDDIRSLVSSHHEGDRRPLPCRSTRRFRGDEVRLLAVIVVLAVYLQPPPLLAQDQCRPTLAPRAAGPQVADSSFEPALPSPAFAAGRGPRVLVDEAHNNFHTVSGRYAPFAKLLRRDGFVVEPLRDRFTRAVLTPARVLVVANAIADRNKDGDWTLPTPSAFAADEIDAVRQWVYAGGSLLLIADHLPFGGASADLAAAFGILLTNSYATDAACGADEFVFRRADGTLGDHPITRGRNARERIDFVRTFTGEAFRVIGPATPLLILAPGSMLLFPSAAWKFSETTPTMRADGLWQGAALTRGRGRIAVFGEAAMFSAQVSGPERRPMGMNMPTAAQNPQFLLNVVHWLVDILPER